MSAERVIELHTRVENRDNGRSYSPTSLAPDRENSYTPLFEGNRLDLLSQVEPASQMETIAAAVKSIHLDIDCTPMSSTLPFTRDDLKTTIKTYILQVCCPVFDPNKPGRARFDWSMETLSCDTVNMLTDILEGKEGVCLPSHIGDFEMEVLGDVLSASSRYASQLSQGNHDPFNKQVVQVLIHNYRRGRLSRMISSDRDDDCAENQSRIDISTLEEMNGFFTQFSEISRNLSGAAKSIGQLLEDVDPRAESNDRSLIREAVYEHIRNEHGMSAETATYFIWQIMGRYTYHELSKEDFINLVSASWMVHTALKEMHVDKQNHRFIENILDPHISHLNRTLREVPDTIGVNYTDPRSGLVDVAERRMTVREREDQIVKNTCAIAEKIVACHNLRKRLQKESQPMPLEMDPSSNGRRPRLSRLFPDLRMSDIDFGNNGNGRKPQKLYRERVHAGAR